MKYDRSPQRLSDLVHRRVAVEFHLEHTLWPIPGYPAKAWLLGVEGSLVCLSDRAEPDQDGVWYSMAIIKSIRRA